MKQREGKVTKNKTCIKTDHYTVLLLSDVYTFTNTGSTLMDYEFKSCCHGCKTNMIR